MKSQLQTRVPQIALTRNAAVTTVEKIEGQICVVRGHPVLLDCDLAEIYGVSTRHLLDRLRREEPLAGELCMTPEREEISSRLEGVAGRVLPRYAFTEHGAFLAGIFLHSREAMAVSVRVVRAFIRHRARRANGGRPAAVT